MADGTVCSFDMTKPRQAWILPPPAGRGVPTDANRQDWMLVIDEPVRLQRGRQVSVQVFEDSGSTWTWVGSTPNRVVRASETEPSNLYTVAVSVLCRQHADLPSPDRHV